MGLKEWFISKGLAKGRANILDTLAKLTPAADASWAKTERCMLAGSWPLPDPDPAARVLQGKLLEDLMIWKGGVSDREAVELIAAELAKAGAGAKMAVRFVVITEWHRLAKTKPTVSQDEMEALLGSREDDKKLIEKVQTYARHHLAMVQASRT